MSVIDELQKNVDSVRRELRNLTVMGMDPKQPADQLALIKQLEISARAEQRLRKDGVDTSGVGRKVEAPLPAFFFLRLDVRV
jgi:hypothetical protein